MVLEAIAERRASSSLALGTKFIVRWLSGRKHQFAKLTVPVILEPVGSNPTLTASFDCCQHIFAAKWRLPCLPGSPLGLLHEMVIRNNSLGRKYMLTTITFYVVIGPL